MTIFTMLHQGWTKSRSQVSSAPSLQLTLNFFWCFSIDVDRRHYFLVTSILLYSITMELCMIVVVTSVSHKI